MREVTAAGQAAMAGQVKAQREDDSSDAVRKDHLGPLDPEEMRRGPITEGRAAPSHQAKGPNTADMPAGPMNAAHIRRPPITEGHARPSSEAAGTSQMAAPPTVQVDGKGPIANEIMRAGGKPMMRRSPRGNS